MLNSKKPVMIWKGTVIILYKKKFPLIYFVCIFDRTALANESLQHDAEVSKLIKDVETYKDMFQKTDTRLSKKVKELNVENKSLMEERDNLKKKVKSFEDYDEIKRELQIMKVWGMQIVFDS